MYLSRQHKFLFCHVPRTGGTSLFEHIRCHATDVERLFLQHLSMKEAKALLGADFDGLFKFAFVRNPWDRLVSWHALTALAKVGYDKSSPEFKSCPDSPHWQGFEQFLEEACHKKVEKFRGDWLSFSQWLQLTDDEGKLLVDEVGRFESYQQDAEKLLLKVGVMQPCSISTNGSKHLHYSEYYSDFGRELVAEAFADDIVNFGYQFEKHRAVSI